MLNLQSIIDYLFQFCSFFCVDSSISLGTVRLKMKPVFCGNFEYETRQSDLERLFGRYGRVERVDMKSGMFF
ncbi:putative RNA recognition motif domain, nucleotide-binding alpha-beta plait domain superfamily [Helianthus anomalus]